MKLILASKSGVRKKILEQNSVYCEVVHSNVDEDQAKESLIAAGANPLLISKNLAELKSTKVSKNFPGRLVLGADSVISLNDKLVNKPNNREEAFKILSELNDSKHFLISSVCIAKNGSMIWNHSETSELIMKKLSDQNLRSYLEKIETKTLLAYGVYQVEANGLDLFKSIKGDMNSIMGLPIKKIKEYLQLQK